MMKKQHANLVKLNVRKDVLIDGGFMDGWLGVCMDLYIDGCFEFN